MYRWAAPWTTGPVNLALSPLGAGQNASLATCFMSKCMRWSSLIYSFGSATGGAQPYCWHHMSVWQDRQTLQRASLSVACSTRSQGPAASHLSHRQVTTCCPAVWLAASSHRHLRGYCCWLPPVQVTPRVGLLKPNSSLRVQLDFAPPLVLMDPQVGTVGTEAAVAAAAAEAAVPPAGPCAQSKSPAAGGAVNSPGGAAAKPPPAPAGTKADQAATPQQQQQHQEENASQAAQCHSSSSSGSSGSDGNPSVARSRWMWHREWLLPCYIRPAAAGDEPDIIAASRAAAAGLVSYSSSSSNSTGTAYSVNVLHLAVTTCAVAPELQLVSPVLPKPPGKNYWVMDFGALPVGERCTRALQLQNTGDCSPMFVCYCCASLTLSLAASQGSAGNPYDEVSVVKCSTPDGHHIAAALQLAANSGCTVSSA